MPKPRVDLAFLESFCANEGSVWRKMRPDGLLDATLVLYALRMPFLYSQMLFLDGE